MRDDGKQSYFRIYILPNYSELTKLIMRSDTERQLEILANIPKVRLSHGVTQTCLGYAILGGILQAKIMMSSVAKK